MRHIISVFFYCWGFCIYAQSPSFHSEYPNENEKWPFLWFLEYDSNENLWVCSETGKLYQRIEEKWTEMVLPDIEGSDIREFTFDNDDNIYVATEGNGLYIYRNDSWEVYNTDNSGIRNDFLYEIEVELKGKVWIINDNGEIISFDGNIFSNHTENGVINHEYIEVLFIDSQDNVWAAAKNFVFRYDGFSWTKFDLDNILGFQSWVNDIIEDTSGNLWFSTWKGIKRFRNNQWEDMSNVSGGKNHIVKTLIDDKGHLWMTELFKGLRKWDGSSTMEYFNSEFDEIPSQIFALEHYDNQIIMVGNIGSKVLWMNEKVSSLENHLKIGLAIFPNPTHSLLTIDSDSKFTNAQIFNINGKLVKGDIFLSDKYINVKGLRSGQYTIKLVNEDGHISMGKFIKL